MLRTRHLIIILTWLSLIFCASSALAAARGILYAVHSNSTTTYLLGSVHVGKKEFYPLPKIVDKSFNEAGLLVMEIDPEKANSPALQQNVMRTSLYPAGDSLRNHVAPATYELAVKEAGALGLPGPAVERFKPWMIAITLQVLYFQKHGFSAEEGIEQYFFRKVEGRKPVVELESAEFQIKLLSSFEENEQEMFLLDTLQNISNTTMLDAMMKAWQEGDARTLENVIMQPLREHPEILPIYEKLFFSRNRNMADQIERLLKEKKRPFVVIGAGHLLGKDGVVEILRRKGYRVEQQ